jgi:hypothetical protein
MESVGRDIIVRVLVKHIRDLYSGWGYAPGPTKEMLASLVVTRAVCLAWREEVSVPNLI